MKTTKEHERLVAINLRKIPESIRYQFKSLCADSHLTMEEAILLMIETAIEKNAIPGAERS